ncbi:MAG: hemolysin III family protein [Asgard group archaeon]|nr:hemolysin III family protein [Asgard group archaeon]
MLERERFAVYSHLIGLIIAIGGSAFMVYTAIINATHRFIAPLYSFSVILIFASSTLYHFFKKKEDEISFWRILDHVAIFVMIAGSYTPLSYIYLSGAWRWGIISAQWFLVLLGLILKPFSLHIPRWIETCIYLLMGWMAIFPIRQFISIMPITVMILVFTGGLAYTVGAILHIMNKQVIPGVFSFHDIFHIFIIIGAACHYFAVYIAITTPF